MVITMLVPVVSASIHNFCVTVHLQSCNQTLALSLTPSYVALTAYAFVTFKPAAYSFLKIAGHCFYFL